MPSRRAVFRIVGTGALASLAGCSFSSRPDVRIDSGVGTLHRADERYIAHGLQPDGDDEVFTTVAADRAPEHVGPDATGPISQVLRTIDDADVFHVVVQLRSTPEAPIALVVDDPRWRGRDTLALSVTVSPWGSLDRIDDEAQRERLRSADELVYTTVWALTPAVSRLPETLELRLTHRQR